MAYSQVGELVEMIRKFHSEMAELCEDMRDNEDDPRLELILDHIHYHEKSVCQALSAYQDDDSADGLLNTWLQYTSTDELKRTLRGAIEEVDTNEELTAEKLIEVMMKVDQRLLEFYKQGREESSVPRVKEFFDSLVQLVEGKEHDFAKGVLELRDGQ